VMMTVPSTLVSRLPTASPHLTSFPPSQTTAREKFPIWACDPFAATNQLLYWYGQVGKRLAGERIRCQGVFWVGGCRAEGWFV
jgi:hypothetical protein